MIRRILFALLPAALLAGGTADAADLAAGKKLARQCGVCHGKNGISRDPEAPHLAGMPKHYFKKQMNAYKTGGRKDPRMSIIAAGLSDDAIEFLAAWYSGFSVSATPPGS